MKGAPGPHQADSWRRPRLHADAALAAGRDYRLTAGELSYLTKVLRLREGDEVYLFDGQGGEFRSHLRRCGRKWLCSVAEAVDFPGADPILQVHLGCGSAARGRSDWAVEKMTELGAASITPLGSFGTSRCDRIPDQRQRWRRLAAAAAAQCGRRILPQVESAASFEQWNETLPAGCARLLLSLAPGAPKLSAAAPAAVAAGSVGVVVGRTSGLDRQEEEACAGAGFQPVSMGVRVLRVESAGAIALAILFAAAGEI